MGFLKSKVVLSSLVKWISEREPKLEKNKSLDNKPPVSSTRA